MSTEQSESAPAADVTQQATTPTATTQRVKNPKRVAAGKMVAERTRLAREEQKKTAEAYRVEKKEAKAAPEAPEPTPTTEGESPKSGGLSANQWIAIGGIGVSLLGIYYKREELMAMAAKPAFDKFKMPEPAPEPASAEQEPARATQRKKGLKKCFERLLVIYITMPSLAQVLIYTAAIGGITLFWTDFTVKTWRMVRRLTDEMLVEEGERRRKMKQEVRRAIEIEDKIKEFAEVEKTGPPN